MRNGECGMRNETSGFSAFGFASLRVRTKKPYKTGDLALSSLWSLCPCGEFIRFHAFLSLHPSCPIPHSALRFHFIPHSSFRTPHSFHSALRTPPSAFISFPIPHSAFISFPISLPSVCSADGVSSDLHNHGPFVAGMRSVAYFLWPIAGQKSVSGTASGMERLRG